VAWFNGGDWGGLRVATHGELLAELCTAVNERMTFAGYTPVTWAATGNTLPAATDFDALRVGDGSIRTTILQMQGAVEDLIDITGASEYLKADGSNWANLAELLTAAGEQATWYAPERVTDIRPLKQIRRAVDQLLYLNESVTVTPGSRTIAFPPGSEFDGNPGAQETSWDEARTGGTSSGGFLSSAYVIGWSQERSLSPQVYFTNINFLGDYSLSWDDSWGKVVLALLSLKDANNLGNTDSDPMGFTINGQAFQANAALGDIDDVDVSVVVDWTASPQDLDFVHTVAADTPCNALPNYGDSGQRWVRIQSGGLLKQLRVGTDLTYG
jgi:hypothetical protein